MRCSLLRWTADRGWSEPLPAVDGPSTMVLVFGDREAAQDPQGLDELHRAYRASVVVGCSTAGQIHRDVVVDGGLTVLVIAFDDATLTLAGEPVPDPATSTASAVTSPPGSWLPIPTCRRSSCSPRGSG